jgi:hypothetical protein
VRIYSPEYHRSQKAACLKERMAFYKVPGVTIALIDGGKVAWNSEHGVLEAGTNRPVTRELALARPCIKGPADRFVEERVTV